MKANELFSLSLLRALQPHNQGNGHLELFRSLDDTLGNVVAAHDTTKDVDEDALDFRVRKQDLKRFLDSLGGCSSVKLISKSTMNRKQKMTPTLRRPRNSRGYHRAATAHPS